MSGIIQSSLINHAKNGMYNLAVETKNIVKSTAKVALCCLGAVAEIYSIAVFLSMFLPIGVPISVAALPFFGKFAVSVVLSILSGVFFSLADEN